MKNPKFSKKMTTQQMTKDSGLVSSNRNEGKSVNHSPVKDGKGGSLLKKSQVLNKISKRMHSQFLQSENESLLNYKQDEGRSNEEISKYKVYLKSSCDVSEDQDVETPKNEL